VALLLIVSILAGLTYGLPSEIPLPLFRTTSTYVLTATVTWTTGYYGKYPRYTTLYRTTTVTAESLELGREDSQGIVTAAGGVIGVRFGNYLEINASYASIGKGRILAEAKIKNLMNITVRDGKIMFHKDFIPEDEIAFGGIEPEETLVVEQEVRSWLADRPPPKDYLAPYIRSALIRFYRNETVKRRIATSTQAIRTWSPVVVVKTDTYTSTAVTFFFGINEAILVLALLAFAGVTVSMKLGRRRLSIRRLSKRGNIRSLDGRFRSVVGSQRSSDDFGPARRFTRATLK